MNTPESDKIIGSDTKPLGRIEVVDGLPAFVPDPDREHFTSLELRWVAHFLNKRALKNDKRTSAGNFSQ